VRIATISGTASEVGKTTLLCALLERLPGWAAVKVTRGHYRSCGRDPDTCCVSHLLGDEPRVFSDRETTDVEGKDTGRYWAAGAAAVRWVVGASGQEMEGLRRALADLNGFPGVLVEGNRIVRGCRPDLAILVASPGQREVKATARRILGQVDALYVPDQDVAGASPESVVAELVGTATIKLVWGPDDLDTIAARLATPGA
jgi:molybdopterin-guanine dinucleotide biosynthesis protein